MALHSPVLPHCDEDDRLPMLPIVRHNLWKWVTISRKAYWFEEEIKMLEDLAHFRDRLNDGERHCLKLILAFFAIADALVNENILERFIKEIRYKEAEAFYQQQAAIEAIHNTVYSLILETLIEDLQERNKLFDSAKHSPATQTMTQYISNCAKSEESLQMRLIRMTCAEGILFSGAFCIIYWFNERGLMPGVALANDFIARDEGLHTMFSIEIYKMTSPPLPTSTIHALFKEAVDIAAKFACDALPNGLVGMNAELMTQYIQYVADSLLGYLDVPLLYKSKNPFGFMEQLNMRVRDNFFERRASQYARTNAGGAGTTSITSSKDTKEDVHLTKLKF